jgi:tetratricopeptide (TPR) repeat protein
MYGMGPKLAMPEIKAFVGHSFADNDKAVVNIFIEHFHTLAATLHGFSWDHAQQAEAESVAGKVLAKIQDKNVFIGICTRSELVMADKPRFRIPAIGLVRLNEIELQRKPSDWIIQEIGLAVGPQMKIIIFLEEGVRRPGALFGDVEYIPFSRERPQDSFDKLLQMLGKINPKDTTAASVGTVGPLAVDKQEAQAEGDEDLNPQTTWDQDKYERAAFRAIVFERDEQVFSTVDAAFRGSPLAKDVALTIWEVKIEWFRMVAGGRSDFDKIKKAVRDNPANSILSFHLGLGYRKLGEHEAAARAFEQAGATAENETEKLRNLAHAASNYAEAGLSERSSSIVETLKQIARGKPDLEYELLLELRDLANIEKDDVFRVSIMERMIELRPDNFRARFQLAFKQEEIGNPDMAIYHYLKIPDSERDSVTWNNLGVSYAAFEMRIKSIGAYRRAEGENETLAMCNIGFKFLEAGFFPEAKEIAERAASIEGHHKNVPILQTQLNDAPETEEKTLTDTLEKTKEKAAFYRRTGEKIMKATPANIDLNWDSPEGPLEAKIEGVSVRLLGSQQRPTLAGILTSQIGGVGHMVTHRIEYAGRIRGEVITCQVKRSRDGDPPPSLLSSAGEKVDVVMIFNDDHSELSVMENPASAHARFYTITRS